MFAITLFFDHVQDPGRSSDNLAQVELNRRHVMLQVCQGSHMRRVTFISRLAPYALPQQISTVLCQSTYRFFYIGYLKPVMS